MRFYLGQFFKHVSSKEEAMIAEIKDQGRMGLLRFVGSAEEEWVSLADVSDSGEWRVKGDASDEAAN